MHNKKMLAATAAVIGLIACAATHAQESKTKQAAAGEAFRPYTPQDYPQITPEVMGARVLKLIDSLKSPDDWSLAHIQQVIGLPMAYAPAGEVYSFAMHLPDSNWYYGIDYDEGTNKRQKSISYRFDNWADGHPNDNVDMSPVCGMDQASFSTELIHLGFEEKPEIGEIGQIEWLNYRRKGISTSIQIITASEGQSTDDKKQHACLKLVLIAP